MARSGWLIRDESGGYKVQPIPEAVFAHKLQISKLRDTARNTTLNRFNNGKYRSIANTCHGTQMLAQTPIVHGITKSLISHVK